MSDDWRTSLVILREKAEVLIAVMRRWEAMGLPIYNPLSASDAVRKPYQMAELARAGLPVPETLWTNDPAAVRRFADGRRIAYKPVAGGAATRELEASDLDDAKLARLANAPVTFQELLAGRDIRVFILDGRVVAAFQIHSQALDYRQNEGEGRKRGARSRRRTHLPDRGFDHRPSLHRDGPQGNRRRHAEDPRAESIPMFLGFDHMGGTDVQGALVATLAAHANR